MNIKNFYGKLISFAQNPKYVFLLALAIAALCTLCYTLFLTDIYRDTAHVYAQHVREFARGNWAEGIANQVPMLNITVAGLFAFLGLEPVKALCLTAGLFFLATCFPLRKLLERYLSPTAAAWGCMLFVCAPKMIRFGCAPLLESSRIFFMIAAILYFLRSAENPKWKNAVLFGISASLTAASRGEGIVLSTALLLGLPVYAAVFCRPTAWKKQLAAWCIAMICAVAAVSPFCAMNYLRNGYFVPDNRLSILPVLLTAPAKSSAAAPAGKEAVGKAASPAPQQNYSVHQQQQLKEKIPHNFSSFIRGGYELYWILSLLGAVMIFWKKQWKNDYLLFAGIALLYFIFYMLTVAAYRYYLFLIPLFMVFTVTGAKVLYDLARKYLPGRLQLLGVALCAVLAIVQICNGLSRAFSGKGKDFIEAGRWIEEYNKKHFPERRLKLYSPMLSEVAYWSKAYPTDGVNGTIHDPATFTDFDLAAVHRKKSCGLEKRSDLERIPDTPHSQNIWIFKLKKQEKK